MSHVKSIRKIKIDGVEYMKNTTNGTGLVIGKILDDEIEVL